MKKNYNCPNMEVIKVNTMTALCESQFGGFNIGGGAGSGEGPGSSIDPSMGG